MTLPERVECMERALNGSAAALSALEQALDAYEQTKPDLAALEDYLSTGQWRRDYEADETGLLPGDMPRGVLSQDALYDLLTQHSELLRRMKAITEESP